MFSLVIYLCISQFQLAHSLKTQNTHIKRRNIEDTPLVYKTGDFLTAVFKKYGNSKSMTTQDFDRLLKHLDIGKNLTVSDKPPGHLQGKCFAGNQLLDIYNLGKNGSLDSGSFEKICPALIQQIDSGSCSTAEKREVSLTKESKGKAWGFSILSVTIISLSSMFGAFVVPFMDKAFYQTVLLLMVSLAVGVLGGSGFFHLFPNSLGLGLDGDYAYLGKCSVVAAGVYLFFITEYLMKMYVRYKDKKHGIPSVGHSHGHSHTHAHSNGGLTPEDQKKSPQNNSIQKKSPHLTTSISKVQLTGNMEIESSSTAPGSPSSIIEEDALFFKDNISSCPSCGGGLTLKGKMEEEENVIDVDEILPSHMNLEHSIGHRPTFYEGMTWAESAEPEDVAKEKSPIPPEAKEEVKHILPHSHHDDAAAAVNDSHPKIKRRIATAAWMIIVGDGLHNFIDGLAIGASFSSSVYEGLSTSLAIICEELPHELGDFAILLNSGMTFKMAIGFNFLSACSCYIGMVIGLLLGYDTSSVKWIYALAGGMFIYISLVDMLPEATEMSVILGGDSLRKQIKTFLIQNIGMSFGFFIMLILGIYGPSISI